MFVVIVPTFVVIAILTLMALIPSIAHPKGWAQTFSVVIISVGLVGLVFTILQRLFG